MPYLTTVAPAALTSTQPVLDCWYLTGPTASGKTEIGLELAERLSAEIISLDSMTLYREMDIGTAKPTHQQQQRVPHHLIDILSPDEEYSLSNYVDAAKVAIAEIRGRGREVLFVGGTPLYLKALLRGIFHGPPADWEFRQQIEDELRTVGLEALHQRLQQVDPLSAAKLHPHDKRRIIRALEVYRLTGRPISHLQTQFEEGQPAQQCRVFVLGWPRNVLHQRIHDRVEAMFAAGLVDEVRQILARHRTLSRTARQAVGYREVLQSMERDDDLAKTIEAVKTRTRRFARHQETWFRSLSECRFLLRSSEDDQPQIIDQILAAGASPATPQI
jgi:tRNA dimethylallyltransferase